MYSKFRQGFRRSKLSQNLYRWRVKSRCELVITWASPKNSSSPGLRVSVSNFISQRLPRHAYDQV